MGRLRVVFILSMSYMHYITPHLAINNRGRVQVVRTVYATTIGRRRIGFEYATVAAIQGGLSTSYAITRQVLTVS